MLLNVIDAGLVVAAIVETILEDVDGTSNDFSPGLFNGIVIGDESVVEDVGGIIAPLLHLMLLLLSTKLVDDVVAVEVVGASSCIEDEEVSRILQSILTTEVL